MCIIKYYVYRGCERAINRSWPLWQIGGEDWREEYRHCPLVTNEALQSYCPARFFIFIFQHKRKHPYYIPTLYTKYFYYYYYFCYSHFFQLRKTWCCIPVELGMASGIKKLSWNNEIHCWIRSFRYENNNRFWSQNTP